MNEDLKEARRLARNAYMRDWKKRNKPKVNAWNQNWKDDNREIVRERGRIAARVAYEADPQKFKDAVKRYAATRKEEVKQRYVKWIQDNPEYHTYWRLRNLQKWIMKSAKSRALQFGLPFNLQPEDIEIPEVCPALGIKLNVEAKRGRPEAISLDRVIPELGYVKGNVRVISTRANRIKVDATADELEAIAAYIRKHSSCSAS